MGKHKNYLRKKRVVRMFLIILLAFVLTLGQVCIVQAEVEVAAPSVILM